MHHHESIRVRSTRVEVLGNRHGQFHSQGLGRHAMHGWICVVDETQKELILAALFAGRQCFLADGLRYVEIEVI